MKKYLFILSGGLVKDKTGKWHTTLGEEGAENGMILNDRLRIVAAAELWRENSNITIVVSGGLGKMQGVLPPGITLASIMKSELIELGIPEECIFLDEGTNSTFEQINSLNEMMKSGKFEGEISIISNRYHLSRIQAMIDHTELREVFGGYHVSLLGAEDVLIRLKPKEWKGFIEEMEKAEGMKERLASEAKGVEEIKKGVYKFR